jgi:hypothetical protein
MTRKRVERQNTSWRISIEAKRLLERMAERSAISQAAVLEQAIREKAKRDNVSLDAAEADGATDEILAALTRDERAAVAALHELAQRVRAGHDVSPDEVQRHADVLRARIPITPAERSGPMAPEEQQRFRQMLDEVRAAVPEAWTEQEIIERANRAVHAVRAARRARGEWPPAEPGYVSPQQQALLQALQELADATRDRLARLAPEEIQREVDRAVAHARKSHRARHD